MCRFLLVSLNIDAILGEVTIRQRRKKLKEMTQGGGLSDAYTATLARLKAQKGNKSALGMKVLMWVMYSERPLRTQELCHALGVEIGSADLDPENVPALRVLLASCLGLVTLEASSSTVRLVHFTLREHLSHHSMLFHSPHSAISEVCLTYLNFECITDLRPTLPSAPVTTPLLEYASVYWGKHTIKGITENIVILALKLLATFDEHISAKLLLLDYSRDPGEGPYFGGEGPTGFSGVHGVAFLGLGGIVSRVLRMREWDVNAYDCMGMTALTWASRSGCEEVVKALLQQEGVHPDRADFGCSRTPLWWAAEGGHRAVVRILLEQKAVDPDRADTISGQTSLSWAAENGHEGIVKILLEREDVNPDQADTEYGQTPLGWAAWNGHEGIVKILLEREDVNPDRADTEYGQTPLSWAAASGHDGIVKMLLGRGEVSPDQADTKSGRTPLSWAAEGGHERVVKLLLQRKDVNPDLEDTCGLSPFSFAAMRGHKVVVRILLEQEAVNPDRADTISGQTPLSWAAEKGHEGVVKILLEREDVNPNQADTEYGRTPLEWAAANGHEGIVNMLMKRKYVCTPMPDRVNQTP